VTEVRRTPQTAKPIAARLLKGTDALVSQLRQAGDNEIVLVVGHADTVRSWCSLPEPTPKRI